MSNSRTNQEITSPRNPGAPLGTSGELPAQTKLGQPSLLGELKKGWDWVVFIWQMGQRLGGFREIVRTCWMILSLMVARTLRQWGLLKR